MRAVLALAFAGATIVRRGTHTAPAPGSGLELWLPSDLYKLTRTIVGV